jgi:N-acetylglutamate synthase-like GNAT family acetyltransferase
MNLDRYVDVENFLKSVPGIKIDVDVVMNASLLMNEGEITGIISFECFGTTGLIRYFIFKKMIDEETLEKLFNNLLIKAKEKDLTKIIAFVSNEETIPIFSFLGFTEVDKKQVYIEEKKYDKNAMTSIYQYEIN